MKKMLILLSLLTTAVVYAKNDEYSNFQKFDNQVSLGFSLNQTTMTNGANNQILQQNQNMSLDVEHQFDLGIWADLNAYMTVNTNSLGSTANATGVNYGMPASQNPYVGGFNAKVGYSWLALTDLYANNFMVTPYIQLGRNTNLSMSAILSNGQVNLTNDYFITGGLGIRLQYIFNKYIDAYFDQAWNYNWDQSGPLNGIQPQNNQVFLSMLGLKANVYQQLQLGIAGFYTNFQYDATAPSTTVISGGTSNGAIVSIYQPQYNFGGLFSVGMTF